jgi:gliding motility-associated-like protein
VDTTYYVNYSDNTGCTNRDSVRVRVVDTVTLKTANDTTICRTDNLLIGIVGNALQFTWTPANTLNNGNVRNPIATPTAATTTYYVQGNIGSCYKRDSITIKTVAYPRARAGADTLICWGTSAALNASGGSFYSWTPTAYLSNALIPNPVSVSPLADYIDYIVEVRDTLGCPKPVYDTIRVDIDRVIADAGPSDTSIVEGQTLQLNATGSINYQWSVVTPNTPSFLTNPNVSNPRATPIDDIVYAVNVSNNIGCEDDDTISVKYYKVPPGFYVPTAFTPNGDGRNDVLTPLALGLKSVDLFMVYNRWGQLMFKTNSIEVGWDGKFKGKVQDIGTYVWYAEGYDYKADKKIMQKGTVVLLH